MGVRSGHGESANSGDTNLNRNRCGNPFAAGWLGDTLGSGDIAPNLRLRVLAA